MTMCPPLKHLGQTPMNGRTLTKQESAASKTDKEDRKRIMATLRQRRRRERMRLAKGDPKTIQLCRRLMLVQVWRMHPKGGFSYNDSKDPNVNCGSCDTTLRYAGTDNLTVKPGRLSLGLVHDNGHTSHVRDRPMCFNSEKNFLFLSLVKQYLCRFFPQHRHMMQCMRIGCVQGAMTVEHNDTMRGATPTFVFIQPSSNFQLRVRQFPLFKVSVVLHNGVPCVPHQHREGLGLTLIGYWGGRASYILLPEREVENLLPHGNLNNLIVVGVKEGKIQVIPANYQVFHTTRDMECVTFQRILEEASKCRVHSKPRYMCRYTKDDRHCTKEYLWMKAHKWQSGSNYDCSRFYAFFRAIREETTSARLVRYSSGRTNFLSLADKRPEEYQDAEAGYSGTKQGACIHKWVL